MKRHRRRRPPVGASPGTLAPSEGAARPRIRVLRYDGDTVEEREVAAVAALRSFVESPRGVLWVDVEGLGDAALLEEIGELFGMHPLALADAVNTHQRPKAEIYGEEVLLVARMGHLPPAGGFETEQIALFVGKNFAVTFQEHGGATLEPVRDRIRRGKGQIRQMGPGYLAYSILDTVVDGYFPLLEVLGEELEAVEEEAALQPVPTTLRKIHGIRRRLFELRRTLWPLRDSVNLLQHDFSPLFPPPVRVYLRDTYDHSVQLLDFLETYHELGSSLMEVYLSSLSNRLNEVMKVLTVISTIFIPLTFLAGLYGMNFRYMPEYGWPWAYPALLAVMALLAGGMFVYFRRKGWIGQDQSKPSLFPPEAPGVDKGASRPPARPFPAAIDAGGGK